MIPANEATWTLQELQEITSGEWVQLGTEIPRGLVTDTRQELEGKLFLALRGERFDAHEFLDVALQKGAAVLIVESVPEGLSWKASQSVLCVPDTLRALGDLARFHRQRWGRKLIAIGGAAGKTTTRSVLSACLEQIAPGRVLSTQANYNNRVGVPLTLLGLSEQHELAVIELGTNEPGEMAELTRISAPDLGLLTLIALEHSEGLGDLDGVEKEEAALFEGLSARQGIACGWGDDLRIAGLLQAGHAAQSYAYGSQASHFAQLLERQVDAGGLSHLRFSAGGRSFSVTTELVGQGAAWAVVAAVTVCEILFPGCIQQEQVQAAVDQAGEPGRAKVMRLPGEILVLDDTYNSNPASAENSIQTGFELAEKRGGRLFLVLGEMLELGALAAQAHEDLAHFAVGRGPAWIAGVQGQARRLSERAQQAGIAGVFVEKAEQVPPLLVPQLRERDVVVVKASRGVRAEKIVSELAIQVGQIFGSSARSGAPEGLHEELPREDGVR